MAKNDDLLAKLKAKKKNKRSEDVPRKETKQLLSRKAPKDESTAKRRGLISKGYEEVEANAKRLERIREQAGNRIYRTWIPDRETKEFRFLNEEPITFYEHRVQFGNSKRPEFVTCLGDDCPLCQIADGRRIAKSRFVGAFLVIDRSEYVSQSGQNKGQTMKDIPRLYVEGQMVLSQLEVFHKKQGLTKREYDITRNDKVKTIVPNDPSSLSKSDKKLVNELLEKAGVSSIDELIVKQIEAQTYSQEELADRFGTEDSSSSKLRSL